MIAAASDVLRHDYRVYLEPCVAVACGALAGQVGVRTVSRYIRRAVLLTMRRDGYDVRQLRLTDPPQHRRSLQNDKGVTP